MPQIGFRARFSFSTIFENKIKWLGDSKVDWNGKRACEPLVASASARDVCGVWMWATPTHISGGTSSSSTKSESTSSRHAWPPPHLRRPRWCAHVYRAGAATTQPLPTSSAAAPAPTETHYTIFCSAVSPTGASRLARFFGASSNRYSMPLAADPPPWTARPCPSLGQLSSQWSCKI